MEHARGGPLSQVISLGALDSLARKQRSKSPVNIFGSILEAVPEEAVPRVTSVLARLHADPSFQGRQVPGCQVQGVMSVVASARLCSWHAFWVGDYCSGQY